MTAMIHLHPTIHTQRSAFARHSDDGLFHGRRVGANRGNFQTRRIQQLGPLRARVLHRSESCHHGQVSLGRLQVHVRVREDHFVEQDGGIRTQGCDDVLKDLATFVVGLVGENGAEVVEFGPYAAVGGVAHRMWVFWRWWERARGKGMGCTLDWLWFENVMSHVLYPWR